MARKNNPIALELAALERKIEEFRDYLDKIKIKSIADYLERHAEIKVQLLMMKELGLIMQQYDLLKKQSEQEKVTETMDTRGDVPLSPLEEGII